MLHDGANSLLLGAVILGAVHGIEPGHGWPVAAAYALDQTNTWFYGFVSSFVLGVGHLISSLAMVAVFFVAKSYFSLTQINEPITLLGGIQIGDPVSLVAGVLLIVLGLKEYFSHTHRSGHSHTALHDQEGHSHDHDHGGRDEVADRGLFGIAWVAFVLGFAHEEEFEIIAMVQDRTTVSN